MSLSWRERLDVLLAPGRVESLRRPAFSARGQAADEPCEEPGGTEAWRGALAGLSRLPAGSCELSLHLASRFVRFQVLPWLPDIAGPEERLAHAAILFRQVYGPAVDAWELRVSDEVPGCAALVSAVDRALLEEISALAREKRWRLVSVRPALALAWNRWRGRVSGPDGFFTLAEEGGFCLAAMEAGAWLGLRNRRLAEDGLQDALAESRRELETCGGAALGQAQAFLADLSGRQAASAAPAGWHVLPGGWRDWL